jgi:hypothetical protein
MQSSTEAEVCDLQCVASAVVGAPASGKMGLLASVGLMRTKNEPPFPKSVELPLLDCVQCSF